MRNEISAGGIIISHEHSTTSILLLKDQKDKWTFPKGLIEKGENTIVCAKREIEEEVGLANVKFLATLTPAHYKYRWGTELINKTVHYFLFEGKADVKLVPQAEEGITDVRWFPTAEAIEIVGYKKTNAKLLQESLAHMPRKYS